MLDCASQARMLMPVKLLLNARPLWLPRAAACLTLLFAVTSWSQQAPAQEVRKAIIPDDLLGDEHLREEFGVNGITTPSIEAE